MVPQTVVAGLFYVGDAHRVRVHEVRHLAEHVLEGDDFVAEALEASRLLKVLITPKWR